MNPPEQRLVLFTRYPIPGRAKTRLIPALGPDGAVDLQRELTAHTLHSARAWAARNQASIEVRFDGASSRRMRQWLGDRPRFRAQGPGDLGDRMARTFAEAFADGSQHVVIIGADCPSLTAATLTEAFGALAEAEIVLGPATDGGYYLVGLKRACPALFQGIAWGTDRVLEQTLTMARRLSLRHRLLAERPDVDRPEDLPRWHAARREAATLAVIVPALNEARHLASTLQAVAQGHPEEIIVADGGSTDATRELARASGAIVVSAPRGRAQQMNAAAATASAARLLFLHADTLPPPGYREVLDRTLSRPEVAAGAFAFGVRDPLPFRRVLELAVAARCRWLRLPYGDQGLFLRRDLFEAIGGFPNWPILEDLEIVRRLAAHGRLTIAPAKVATSSRRWRARGLWRTVLIHQLILVGHACGVSPERLARLRSPNRGRGKPSDAMRG
jgi:uncharacterized protein